jgi:hypothetical protein
VVLSVQVTTRNKTATRMAEAMWLSFMPAPDTSPGTGRHKNKKVGRCCIVSIVLWVCLLVSIVLQSQQLAGYATCHLLLRACMRLLACSNPHYGTWYDAQGNNNKKRIRVRAVAEWTMDVLGSPVSPMEVLANATRHLHAVWDGVTWTGATADADKGATHSGTGIPPPSPNRTLTIRTLDSPLVSPSDIHHLLQVSARSKQSVL